MTRLITSVRSRVRYSGKVPFRHSLQQVNQVSPCHFPVKIRTGFFINDSGKIAGWGLSLTTFEDQPFVGTSSGVMSVLLPSTASLAGNIRGATVAGFNNSDEIVGTLIGDIGNQAFFGTAAGVTSLPYPFVYGINDAGQILVGDQANQLYILTGNSAVPIPGAIGSGAALNNAGQAVGVTASGQAFVGTTNGVTLIPLPTGANFELFVGINNSGDVVGTASNGSTWIWDPVGGLQLLSTLVPAGWTVQSAWGINDLGQIVGDASFTDPNTGNSSQSAASFSGPVILTPLATPEPGTLSMMFAAMAVFGAAWIVRRRRLV